MRSASNRAPAGVTVRSTTESSDPSRAPESVREISRLARVAASMSSVLLSRWLKGRASAGRSAFCVRST